jgi:hypothetical protein
MQVRRAIDGHERLKKQAQKKRMKNLFTPLF